MLEMADDDEAKNREVVAKYHAKLIQIIDFGNRVIQELEPGSAGHQACIEAMEWLQDFEAEMKLYATGQGGNLEQLSRKAVLITERVDFLMQLETMKTGTPH